jgi:hypothetical protein
MSRGSIWPADLPFSGIRKGVKDNRIRKKVFLQAVQKHLDARPSKF